MYFNNNSVFNISETSAHSLIYVDPLEQPLLTITAIFLPLIILGTIVGNLLVIKAIFGEPTLRQAQNYPLASLAVADLLTATVVMTQGAMYEILQYWPLNIPLCYFWIVTDVFLCTASIFNICLIGKLYFYSFDHFQTIFSIVYIHFDMVSIYSLQDYIKKIFFFHHF